MRKTFTFKGISILLSIVVLSIMFACGKPTEEDLNLENTPKSAFGSKQWEGFITEDKDVTNSFGGTAGDTVEKATPTPRRVFYNPQRGSGLPGPTPTPTPSREAYVPKGDAKVYGNRGYDYWKAGQYRLAIEALDEAIRIDPEYVNAYNNRGNAYAGLYQVKQAMENYNEAIRLDPEYAIAYNGRGNAYRALFQPDKAIKDFDEAIRLDPEFAMAYRNRGHTYAKDTLYIFAKDQAISDYTEAIRINPNVAQYYIDRGNTYLGVRQELLAIKDFDEAIRLDPKNHDGHHGKCTAEEQLRGVKFYGGC